MEYSYFRDDFKFMYINFEDLIFIHLVVKVDIIDDDIFILFHFTNASEQGIKVENLII